MKLTDKQLAKIKEQARNRYPQEAVWVITSKGMAIELENVAEDPINDFAVDQAKFWSYEPKALVHSHTIQRGHMGNRDNFVDPRAPSGLDMQSQIAMDLPWGILAVDEDTVTDLLWFPDYDAELLGKPYISGVYDCYTLVQRYYYQNYGIKLYTVPYSPLWWETEPRLYIDNFKDAGFYEVRESELEVGDMILIRIFGDVATHSAVYLGNDQIMHHMGNRLSVIENYSRWRSRMVTFLSHDKGKSK